jgi:predicted secreted protein
MLSSHVKGEHAVNPNEELSFEFLLCGEYENLLNQCQQAFEHWNDRSEHLRQEQKTGEATGRELLRLQARFAKAYTILQRHVERCERCQLAAKMNVSEADAHALAITAN